MFIWVLFVQMCTKCFICNALLKDLEVLPANYEIRISFKWVLYNIAGGSVLHEIQTSLKHYEKSKHVCLSKTM